MFTCKTEHPAAVVIWRKGLLELRASGKHMPSQEGLTLKLTISALEKVDSDTYTCDIGQAQSQARLLVQGEASTLHGFHSLWCGQCKPCLKQTGQAQPGSAYLWEGVAVGGLISEAFPARSCANESAALIYYCICVSGTPPMCWHVPGPHA